MPYNARGGHSSRSKGGKRLRFSGPKKWHTRSSDRPYTSDPNLKFSNVQYENTNIGLIQGKVNDTKELKSSQVENLNMMQMEMSKFGFGILANQTDTVPLFNVSTQKVLLDPDHISCAPMLNDAEINATVNHNLKSRFDLDTGKIDAYNQLGTSCIKDPENCFITTFGLIPNESMPDNEKHTFTTENVMASIAHKSRKLDCIGTMKFSVFGACAEDRDMNDCVKLYRNTDGSETAAGEYVCDAMISMCQLSKVFRRNEEFPKGACGKICDYYSVLNSLPKEEHTSHGVIKTYITTCKGKYNYGGEREMMKGAKVTSLKVSMKIETVTFTPRKRDVQTESRCLQHIRSKAIRERILTQTVSYSAVYVGTGIPDRGYDLKMVSVNSGPESTWKTKLQKGGTLWNERVGMIVFDIGNGIPMQYIIHSTEKNPNNTAFIYSPNDEKNLSSEVLFAALIRALRNNVTGDYATKYLLSEASTTVNSTLVQGIQKNQPKITGKEIEKQYMNINDVTCTPLHGVISSGTLDTYYNPFLLDRSEAVTVFACVGTPFREVGSKIWKPNENHTRTTKSYTGMGTRFFETSRANSYAASDIDMDEVMYLAARPSAFDD